MKLRNPSLRRAARSSNLLGLCTITFTLLTAGQSMAQLVWTGAAVPSDPPVPADTAWSNSGNWLDTTTLLLGVPADGIVLNFGGATHGAPTIQPTNNDITPLTSGAINFISDGTGGQSAAFTLGTAGLSITLGGSISTTPITTGGATINDVINLNLILNANRTISTNANTGGLSHNITINGIISESATGSNLIKGGGGPSGSLTLTGNNTYTGITQIETGTVNVTKIADSGDSNLGYGNLKMGNNNSVSVLNYTGSGNTTARTLLVGTGGGAGGGTINHNGSNAGTGLVFSAPSFTVAQAFSGGTRSFTLGGTNTDANQISGVIADVSGTTKINLTKANAGLWILSGANTYSGSTTVTGGTLAGIGSNAFGSTSGISIAAAGTLSLRGGSDTSFQKTSDSSLYMVSTSASGATLNVDSATPVVTTAKTMTIGALATSSTANSYQVNFTGTNNTSLTIGAMTGPASASSTAKGAVTINNTVSSTGILTLASYTSANAGTSAGVGETVTFGGSGNTTVTGAITPSATPLALTKSGGGTLRLDGASTYTGITLVSGGSLHLNNANALPASSGLTLNGGVLGLGVGNFTRPLGNLGGQVQIIAANSGFAAYGADRVVNLGGAGAVVTFGSGSFFTAGTTMVLGATTATHTVDFQNPINMGTSGKFFRTDDGAATVDGRLSGAITGTGTFSKAGTGTLEMANTGNLWSGTTFVDSGTLRLGAANVLPSNSVVVKRGTGVTDTSGALDLNGFNETIGALTLGESANDTKTPAQTPSVVNSSLTPATLTLGGSLSYESGNTSNQNGQATISVNLATGVIGNRDINVENGSAPEDLVISGGLSGGSITKQGTGTLLLSNPAISGNTTVSDGTLVIRKVGAQTNANPNNDASAITIAAGKILNLDYSGTDVVGSLVIGSSAVPDGVYGAADFPEITGTGTITVVTPPADLFQDWAGEGLTFGGDENADGVSNGLAWLLGAANAYDSALDKLPTLTLLPGGNLKMTFDMLPSVRRGGATLTLQHSSDLGIGDPWAGVLVPDATGGSAPVTFIVSDIDLIDVENPLDVEATISSSETAAGKLFGRLKAER